MTERYRQFDELFAAAADSTATPEDIAVLDEMLRADADARSEYLRYQRLNALLERYERIDDPPARPTEEVLREICETVEVEDADSPKAEVALPTRRFRASRHKLSISIAVAVAVMVSTLLTMHLMEVSPFVANKAGKTNEANTKDAADHDFVASLSDWHNDHWLEDTRPPRHDPRMKAGTRLVLASGLVEITYGTGAVVVLEGPAEFVVGGTEAQRRKALSHEDPSRRRKPADAANSGYLALGSLVARVEGKGAQGFTIDTPTARIEDLGTEFGVNVSSNGISNVHVFEGSVRFNEKRDHEPAVSHVLTAGRSARLAADGKAPNFAALPPSLFPKRISALPPRSSGDPAVLHDRFGNPATSDALWKQTSVHASGLTISAGDASHTIRAKLSSGQVEFRGKGPSAKDAFDSGRALVSRQEFSLPEDGQLLVLEARLTRLSGSAGQCIAGIGFTNLHDCAQAHFLRKKTGMRGDLFENAVQSTPGISRQRKVGSEAIKTPVVLSLTIDAQGRVRAITNGKQLAQFQVDVRKFDRFRVALIATARTRSDDVEASFDEVRVMLEDLGAAVPR